MSRQLRLQESRLHRRLLHVLQFTMLPIANANSSTAALTLRANCILADHSQVSCICSLIARCEPEGFVIYLGATTLSLRHHPCHHRGSGTGKWNGKVPSLDSFRRLSVP